MNQHGVSAVVCDSSGPEVVPEPADHAHSAERAEGHESTVSACGVRSAGGGDQVVSLWVQQKPPTVRWGG